MFMKSCVLEVLLSRKTLNAKFIIIVLEMFQECKVMFGSLVVSLTSMCQIGKALLNYTLIGSTVTPFIHMLMDAVEESSRSRQWALPDGFKNFLWFMRIKVQSLASC